MDEKAWRYGCLFCRTGAEAIIASYINQTITDVEAVAPTRTRRKTVAGKAVEDQVQLLVDEDVLQGEYLGCHPCVNTSSLKIKTKDVFERFLPAVHHDMITVHLTGEA